MERGEAVPFLVAVACTVATAVVLTMLPLRVIAAPQSGSTQTSSAPLPAFEVASVKINADPGCCGTTKFSADTVIFRTVVLSKVLMMAYGVRDFQILGPDWLGVAGASGNPTVYDIEAKAAGPVSN
jgi:hypothetical protein